MGVLNESPVFFQSERVFRVTAKMASDSDFLKFIPKNP
jgi:hypothetical protein